MGYIERLQAFGRRNSMMMRLHRAGWSAAKIAKRYKISRQRVQQIIARDDAAPQRKRKRTNGVGKA